MSTPYKWSTCDVVVVTAACTLMVVIAASTIGLCARLAWVAFMGTP